MAETPPFHAPLGQHGNAHDNVGKMTHGAVGNPRLDVVLGERDQGRCDDGESRHIGCGHTQSQIMQGIQPETGEHDPAHGKGARFNHGHRVQQAGNRRGRHHSRWQSAVQRHDGCFGKACQEQDIYHNEQHRVGIGWENPFVDVPQLKVEGSAQHIGNDHGRQEKRAWRSPADKPGISCPPQRHLCSGNGPPTGK